MRLKLLFGLLIFTNIIWATTEVAPPSNDNFADAIPITCGNNYTGSTLEATIDEGNSPDSIDPAVDLDAPNIWYSYTGSGTPEIVTLDLCASGYDTAYLVYTGTSGNLSLVDANDDNETQCGPGYRSYGTFQSDGTTTYYITITGYGPSDTGTVDLTVSCLPADAILIPDANFEQALIDLSVDTGTVNGYISSAGLDQVNDLNVSNYNISDLTGIEHFTGLQFLNVSSNNLTSLDLTANTSLTSLNCSFNSITFLNLDNQTSLTSLQCTNNIMSGLSVKNGNNTNITLFDARNNTNLECIEVDNPTYSTTNWTNIDVNTVFSVMCTQSTYVPDDIFEQALIDLGYDSVLDDYVLTANINTVTILDLLNRDIADLTGIEGFVGLKELVIDSNDTALTTVNLTQNPLLERFISQNNSLTSLDVTQNPLLKTLFVNGNSLSSIDVSQNTQLVTLAVSGNSLTSLDVTQNPLLTQLYCNDNNISTLDTSQNPALSSILAGFNSITTIDLSQNSLLQGADFPNNQLSTIDVSQNLLLTGLGLRNNSQISSVDVTMNPNLRGLNVSNTQVSSLDISNNLALRELYFSNTTIATIDVTVHPELRTLSVSQSLLSSINVSENPMLLNLYCRDNALLTSLNMRNGNNTNLNLLLATNTPNLTCIQVDDVAYSTTNWTNIDAGTTFNTNCSFSVNDECVDAINISTSTLSCENEVRGSIQYATDSNSLRCFGNNANFSDVWYSFTATETSHVIKLQNLLGSPDFLWHALIDAQTYNCGNITDAIYCTDALEDVATGLTIGNTYYIQVYSHVPNANTTFDICVSPVVPANQVFVPDDNFEQALIDLGYDTVLDNLVLRTNINTVENLDVSERSIADLTGIEDFTALKELRCETNNLTNLNITQNTQLTLVHAFNNTLTNVDFTQNTALEQLFISSNQLTTIDVSQNTALVDVSIFTNPQLPSVDVSANSNLKTLNISFTSISEIDVSNNLTLERLSFVDCPISEIDVTANLELRQLSTSQSLVTSVDVSGNPFFEWLSCRNSPLLTRVNMQNGNNTNVVFFLATDTPNLTCIQVDDAAYSTANWTSITAGTSFSTDCGYLTNDECIDAISVPISDGTCNNTVSGTLNDATNSNSLQCFGNSVGFSDVWFSFVATETTHKIALQNLAGSPNFLWHALIDAQTYTCGNITDAIYCTDGLENTATELTIGNTYYIQVYSHVANADTTFDICISTNTILGQTYVPDDNFEQALIDLGYDIYLDDYVTTTNINTLEILSIDNKNISSLTGIEDFTALEQLHVGNNPLGNLNLTQNPALVLLNANNTSLSTIDLTQNTVLQYLSIESNQLTTIDITQNTALISASFQSNQLATIDVSQNLVLETLNLVLNAQFWGVDVSANSSLRTLNLNLTQVLNIDVSNNPNLESFLCFDCPLRAIDVSANPALKILSVGGTQVPFVDISNNPAIENLFANSCGALTGINAQNGNNTNVATFFASNVPNLTCIQVDDVAYSTANWTNVDGGTNFSTDCGFLENDQCVNAIDIPISDATCNNTVAGTLFQATNSNSLQCFGESPAFSDVWYSFVATETTHTIKILNTSGANSGVSHAVIDAQTYNCGNITDAIYCTDGLENIATELTIGNTYFIQVYSYASGTTETFDICVSTNTIPGQTYVPDNNFEQALINLGLDTVLDDYVTTANINTVNDLNIRDLSIFDLTGIEDFAALEILNCGLNFLGELDLSNNTNLNYLIADNSALVGLNVQNGNNTNVTTFITLGNVDLFCIQVDNAAYSTDNWTLIESSTSFSEYCGNPILVDAKVYLQGAMLQHTDDFMRTDLKNNDHISTVSPYTDGTAILVTDPVFTATGQDKIVDWIWIELRDATNPAIIIDGKSALLQRDGDIVEVLVDDASTPVSFSQAPGDYYIVIKHRNHLGIMSGSTFSLSNVATTVDFTNSNNQITYGTNAQTIFGMPTNTVGMWSGNVNGDTVVQYSGTTPDVPAILSRVLNDAGNFLNFPTYTVSGYDANDVNMDGSTQYTGTNPDTPFILQNILTHPGNFLNFSTYQIIEQLPENE